MKLRAEISEWSDDTKNGVYLTNDSGDQCYAYAPFGISTLKYFKNPITINLRYRKFLDLWRIPEEEAEPEGIKEIGSKGNAYYVTENSCTCSGFKYRGTCKHWEKHYGNAIIK